MFCYRNHNSALSWFITVFNHINTTDVTSVIGISYPFGGFEFISTEVGFMLLNLLFPNDVFYHGYSFFLWRLQITSDVFPVIIFKPFWSAAMYKTIKVTKPFLRTAMYKTIKVTKPFLSTAMYKTIKVTKPFLVQQCIKL